MIGRGRFSAQVQTPRGESAKEYVVADGALVLDDDVFHHYYFIARARGTVAAVVPRRGVQVTLTVAEREAGTVNVGGQSVTATQLSISERGGPERLVWVDAQGRLLRIEIPARGIVAVRDQMPR
jgi:hypothetical protein